MDPQQYAPQGLPQGLYAPAVQRTTYAAPAATTYVGPVGQAPMRYVAGQPGQPIVMAGPMPDDFGGASHLGMAGTIDGSPVMSQQGIVYASGPGVVPNYSGGVAPQHYANLAPAEMPPAEEAQKAPEMYAAEEGQRVSLVVPEGAAPGTKLQYAAPDGQELRLTVPDGVPPGSVMTLTQDPVTKQWKCMAEPADGGPPQTQPPAPAPAPVPQAPMPQPGPPAVSSYTVPSAQPERVTTYLQPTMGGPPMVYQAPGQALGTAPRIIGGPMPVNLSYVPPPVNPSSVAMAPAQLLAGPGGPILANGMPQQLAGDPARFNPPRQMPGYPDGMPAMEQRPSYTPPPVVMQQMPSYTPMPQVLQPGEMPQMQMRVAGPPLGADTSLMATTAKVHPGQITQVIQTPSYVPPPVQTYMMPGMQPPMPYDGSLGSTASVQMSPGLQPGAGGPSITTLPHPQGAHLMGMPGPMIVPQVTLPPGMQLGQHMLGPGMLPPGQQVFGQPGALPPGSRPQGGMPGFMPPGAMQPGFQPFQGQGPPAAPGQMPPAPYPGQMQGLYGAPPQALGPAPQPPMGTHGPDGMPLDQIQGATMPTAMHGMQGPPMNTQPITMPSGGLPPMMGVPQ